MMNPSERVHEYPYQIRDELTMKLLNRGRTGLNTWRGIEVQHEPIFMNSLRLLIEELKPRTILEFGTYRGGLTTYMIDIMSLSCHDILPTVISCDIDNTQNASPSSVMGADLRYLDVYGIWKFVSENHEELLGLEHPILVVEDVGLNTLEILRALDVYLNQGDYFVACHTRDQDAYIDLSTWTEGRYLVDSYLCDIFGRNFIENPNGFFIKK